MWGVLVDVGGACGRGGCLRSWRVPTVVGGDYGWGGYLRSWGVSVGGVGCLWSWGVPVGVPVVVGGVCGCTGCLSVSVRDHTPGYVSRLSPRRVRHLQCLDVVPASEHLTGAGAGPRPLDGTVVPRPVLRPPSPVVDVGESLPRVPEGPGGPFPSYPGRG